jgi:hypothetical protein
MRYDGPGNADGPPTLVAPNLDLCQTIGRRPDTISPVTPITLLFHDVTIHFTPLSRGLELESRPLPNDKLDSWSHQGQRGPVPFRRYPTMTETVLPEPCLDDWVFHFSCIGCF